MLAIQSAVAQSVIVYYPLSEFDGKMKTKRLEQSYLEHFPQRRQERQGRDEVGEPGEGFRRVAGCHETGAADSRAKQALYEWIGKCADAAAKDPKIKQAFLRKPPSRPSAR